MMSITFSYDFIVLLNPQFMYRTQTEPTITIGHKLELVSLAMLYTGEIGHLLY